MLNSRLIRGIAVSIFPVLHRCIQRPPVRVYIVLAQTRSCPSLLSLPFCFTVVDKTLLGKTGIDPEWIEFTSDVDLVTCPLPEPGHPQDCPANLGERHWYGVPKLRSDVEVPNPKDTVTGLGNLEVVRYDMTDGWGDMVLGQWDGDYDDLVQVFSLPVFMLQQAVETMAEVKIIGEEQEEIEAARRKDFILQIVTAVFCLIPFVGEAGLLAAGATNLARMAALAGELGNTGLTIYDMVEDPDSSLVSVLGMLFGAGGLAMAAREATSFRTMAQARREITIGGRAASFGAVFKERDDLLQNISNKCRV